MDNLEEQQDNMFYEDLRMIKNYAYEKIKDLLKIISDLENTFEGRKFALDGHSLGSAGEVIAACHYDIDLYFYNELENAKLKDNNILGRRYFYPLISEFVTYKGLESAKKENLPVAHKLAESVICLPMYADLTDADVDRIIKVVVR